MLDPQEKLTPERRDTFSWVDTIKDQDLLRRMLYLEHCDLAIEDLLDLYILIQIFFFLFKR